MTVTRRRLREINTTVIYNKYTPLFKNRLHIAIWSKTCPNLNWVFIKIRQKNTLQITFYKLKRWNFSTMFVCCFFFKSLNTKTDINNTKNENCNNHQLAQNLVVFLKFNLQAVRTGVTAEKKATRFSILPRSFDGSQFSCCPNSSGFLPMKSSQSLEGGKTTHHN